MFLLDATRFCGDSTRLFPHELLGTDDIDLGTRLTDWRADIKERRMGVTGHVQTVENTCHGRFLNFQRNFGRGEYHPL